jgi:hypothetical protein
MPETTVHKFITAANALRKKRGSRPPTPFGDVTGANKKR